MQRRNYQQVSKNSPYGNYGNVYVDEEERKRLLLQRIEDASLRNKMENKEEEMKENRELALNSALPNSDIIQRPPSEISTFPVSHSVRNKH